MLFAYVYYAPHLNNFKTFGLTSTRRVLASHLDYYNRYADL